MEISTLKQVRTLGLFVFLLLGSVLSGRAQLKDQLNGLKMASGDPMSKIGAELAGLKRESELRPRARTGAVAEVQSENSLLQVRAGDYVVVDAVAEGDNTRRLLADLTALGLTKATSFGRVVSGLMPIAALNRMADLRSLRFARPAYQPASLIGQATSGGDRAMGSDLARRETDVIGRRSKIGVLSDSYNSLGGAAAGIRSGDLPGGNNRNGFITPVQVLEDLEPGIGSDEGRAMLEIIHDVAPGAKLAFATALTGEAGFAQNILNLQGAGCNIIVDDILYFTEPFFQDGLVAQAVDVVKSRGVSYFSAAGNSGRNSYESPFRVGGLTSFGSQSVPGGIRTVNAHNFASEGQPADLMQSITVPAGTTIYVSLQYDQPFYSAGRGRNPGASSDLDIFLLSEDSTKVLAGSASNNVGRDPVEVFSFYNNGTYGSNQFNLLIDKTAGPTPGKIKYIIFGRSILNEYNTQSATCYGHPNAAGAVATGAAYFMNTPAFDRTLPLKESSSSAGGVPILFDANGTSVSPVVRSKPELVAPDGVVTTFFHQLTNGEYYFFGTSAAAPHAAGVAALMQEANGGRLSPDTIRETLQETTVEMETPGFDFNTGYGLIDA
ncbi:MAG: S8 family serine peptidase, partial [Ferruginibacter sp.]|nr:S8 family serine peptidase [Cytophagales bacterium]